jgi:hypothetical protein
MGFLKMPKSKITKLFTIISISVLISAAVMIRPVSSLTSQNVISWFWTSDTNIAAIATGDVNGDGNMEIVTAGYYNDGLRWIAQLVVWNAANNAVINLKTWYWTSDTQISSVAIGDVNGDGQNEIVTGGSYFDGTRWIAQLVVWNGATLAFQNVKAWYWISDTQISSVAVANITGSLGLDIVTGGAYFDGTRWIAQLVTWRGPNLALGNVQAWYWTSNTNINSIAVANITGGTALSIVTGGSYNDGTRNIAQLVVWNGSNLALQNFTSWYWVSNTEVASVAAANVTGGSALSIVTGGSYNDGTRNIAQLVVWNGSNLALQNVVNWYTISDTAISSVAIGNYTGGNNLDIATAGKYNDGSRSNAQLMVLNGTNLSTLTGTNWFTISDTQANSLTIGNTNLGNRIIAGGSNFDLVRSNAQLTVWG